MATFWDAVGELDAIIGRVSAGAEAAANEMASVFKVEVQAVLLSRRHAFSTKTPSPAGTPPAAISGALAASMLNEQAVEIGPETWMSKSGPTAPWSRIQELGGTMTAHSERGMRWQEPPGVWHFSMEHDLPARPYMKPVAEAMSDSGEFTDVAAAAFEAVVIG